MYDFLSRHKVILLLFGFWYLIGSLSVPAFFGVGTVSVFLLWRKGMYFEIFLGFLFILILSDNLRSTTDFAKDFKNIYILLLAAIAVFDRQRFAPFNTVFKYFLPFAAVALVGLFFSPEPVTSIQKLLSYILLFFAVPQFLTKSFRMHGVAAIKDLAFFGVLFVLIGFLLWFIDPGVAISHGSRFRGVFGNPNGLGIFTSLLLILIVVGREYFKAAFSKSDLRWLLLSVLLAVVLSGSRTSILASFLFLIFIRFYRVSPFVGFIFFIGVATGVEAISSNLVAIIEGLGLSDFFRVETLDQGSGRYIAWNFAWLNIQDHFWFGRGFAFDEWLMDLNQPMLNILGHQGGVHNTYLIIWLNTGLVGLLIFFRAVFLLFLQAAHNTAIAFPALWLVLFSISLEPWLAASLNPFTVLLVMAITLMTDDVFQPYIRGEVPSIEKAEKLSLAI